MRDQGGTPCASPVSRGLGSSLTVDLQARMDDLEKRFRALLDRGGLDQPDEVEHDALAEELVFMWHTEKVAIVVEPDEDGPTPPL